MEDGTRVSLIGWWKLLTTTSRDIMMCSTASYRQVIPPLTSVLPYLVVTLSARDLGDHACISWSCQGNGLLHWLSIWSGDRWWPGWRFRDKRKLKNYLRTISEELKREAKSKTTFTDQTSAVSHFWIETEDQLGVKVNIFTNVTSEFRSLCVQTL